MSGYDDSNDHQPMLWLQGRPIYAAYLLVIIYLVSMLITTVVMFFRAEPWLNWLTFDSGRVLSGEAWRVLTYGLVNPPSLFFVVDMFMLGWFGREVERDFGRRLFLKFYLCLYLLTPLLFTLIGLEWLMTIKGVTGTFALFIAFATLHPEAMMMFNILAKWLAIILVGIATLMALAYHDTAGLISLWATVGFAYAFVRHHQGHLTLPDLRFWRRKSKFRVLPDLPAEPRTGGGGRSMAEMDALLDKIARAGIGSLTAKERAKLDASRTELLKKKGPANR